MGGRLRVAEHSCLCVPSSRRRLMRLLRGIRIGAMSGSHGMRAGEPLFTRSPFPLTRADKVYEARVQALAKLLAEPGCTPSQKWNKARDQFDEWDWEDMAPQDEVSQHQYQAMVARSFAGKLLDGAAQTAAAGGRRASSGESFASVAGPQTPPELLPASNVSSEKDKIIAENRAKALAKKKAKQDLAVASAMQWLP